MTPFEPQNIAAYLPYRAQHNPDLLAVAIPKKSDARGKSDYTELTYSELNQLSDLYARGLAAYGIKPGMRCALMVKPSIDFFALTFALFKAGAVLVCIDPGMGLKNIKKCLAESEPDAFIGIPKAHSAKALFQWPSCRLNLAVCKHRQKKWLGIDTLEQIKQLGNDLKNIVDPISDKQELAAILFTSGSTGVPKGVVYRHAHFLAQVKALEEIYQIQVGERDLCTFPLFALFAPALGMSSIVPDMDFTKPGSVKPLHIIEPIHRYQISNMFGSPALIKQIARYGSKHHVELSTLRRVISAGAPAQAKVLELFSKLLPHHTQIFTPYGATESLPVSSIGSIEILSQHRVATDCGKGVCVGKIAAHMQVSIIPISDEPIAQWNAALALAQGEIGEIVVQGPVVTERYYNRPQSTLLAKILNGPHMMHRMGDLGYIDTDGKLWFCGRKSHRVVTTTKTYYTIPCEAIFNTHPMIERSALIPIIKNDAVHAGICLELSRDNTAPSNPKKLIQELGELVLQFEHLSGIQTFYIYPKSFPVDVRHNAKIGREQLAQWARSRKSIVA